MMAAMVVRDHLLELVAVPGRDHHVGPRLGQRDRGGRPDAPARTGDDGDASGDVEEPVAHEGPPFACQTASHSSRTQP